MQWGKTVISYSPNILRLFVFCLLCLLVCLLCLFFVAFACLFVVFVFCCICLFLCCVFLLHLFDNAECQRSTCALSSSQRLYSPLVAFPLSAPTVLRCQCHILFLSFFASCFFLSKVLLCPFLSDELLYVVPLHLYLKFMLITHC